MDESQQPSAVPAAIPTVAPIEGGLITADLPCSRCAYNLRGLTPETRCPECGTPVAQSLYGNWLRLAHPDWLKKLKLGAVLKLWGLVLGIVLGFFVGFAGGFMAASPAGLGILLIGTGLVGGILSLAATFLITAPEPTIGRAEDPVTLRKVIRMCAVAGLLGGVLSEGGAPGALDTVMVIAGSALSLVGLVTTFGEFVYLRRFARRIPDPKLEQRTSLVMWGFGITAAVTAVVGLVAVILSVAAVGPVAPGGTVTTTTSGAGRVSVSTTVSITPAAGPAGLFGGIAAGFVMCFVGLAFLVFFVLYVSLLVRYHRAFKQAAAEAELISRGELPPFQLSPAPPPPAT